MKRELTFYAIAAAVAIVSGFLSGVGGENVFSRYAAAAFGLAMMVLTVAVLRRWLGRKGAAEIFALLIVISFVVELFDFGVLRTSAGYRIDRLLFWPTLAAAAYAVGAVLTRRAAFRAVLSVLALFCFAAATFAAVGTDAAPTDVSDMPVSVLSVFAGSVMLIFAIGGYASFKRPLLPTPASLAAGSILLMLFAAAFQLSVGWRYGAAPTLLTPLLPAAVACYVFFKYKYRFAEMIVLADDDGRPIATGPKLASHDDSTPLHLAFSVFLFNRRGELLLQQRALSKKTWPGVWSNSCCGHQMLHEDVCDAAARRLRDELGLRDVTLHIVLPKFRYRAEKDGVIENEICPVLIGFTDDTARPNADEVNAVEWRSWAEIRAAAASADSGLSPWAVEEIELLAKSALFISLFARYTSPALASEPAA